MKNWILLPILFLVVLASCDKETVECPGSTEKTFAHTGFTKIKAGDNLNITINKGEAFSIKASGCVNDLDDLDISPENGGFLNLRYNHYERKRYRVEIVITMPELVDINLSGAAKGVVNGFAGKDVVIRTILSGASECTVNGTAINAQLDISGASVLTLTGHTESLYGSISGASKLNAYGLVAVEADISASGASKAYVAPSHRFFAEATGASIIYYKGNPVQKHFETSGDGKIVQE